MIHFAGRPEKKQKTDPKKEVRHMCAQTELAVVCLLVLRGLRFISACREKASTALFFKYNTQLGPPYQVLVDTNFINFSIKNKVLSTNFISYCMMRWKNRP